MAKVVDCDVLANEWTVLNELERGAIYYIETKSGEEDMWVLGSSPYMLLSETVVIGVNLQTGSPVFRDNREIFHITKFNGTLYLQND